MKTWKCPECDTENKESIENKPCGKCGFLRFDLSNISEAGKTMAEATIGYVNFISPKFWIPLTIVVLFVSASALYVAFNFF